MHIGVPEGEKGEGAESLFDKIWLKTYQNWGRKWAFKGLQLGWTRPTSRHIIIKLSKVKHKRERWTQQEKSDPSCQGTSHKIIEAEILQAGGVRWYIQSAERKNLPRTVYLAKLLFTNEREIKTFSDKQKLREIIILRLTRNAKGSPSSRNKKMLDSNTKA